MQQKVLNNRYELERKIGEGGMARVYLGRDLRLSRRVAVKVLHSQYASDPSFIGRFNHEAQAAANLRHPNIIDIYDVGQDGDIPYIVMEYVEGQDLKALLRLNGPLPIERAVQIAEDVADALDAAHRAGLIHRDIKPQNIIVGANGVVKITDFGIAKSSLSTSATETGVVFGTADYLSPEQARGLPAGPASDVYSLGISLYEMLTGRLPFNGDTSVAVAMQHVSTPPPPPSRINPRIPPQLENLVVSALEKDPARRPASARAFAQQLKAYRLMGDQGTVLRPSPNAAGPARQPAQPATTNTTQRYEAPVARPASRPRPATTPPPRQSIPARSTVPTPHRSGGMGFGGFLLGLLLIVGVLLIIGVIASGALSGLIPNVTLPINRPTNVADTTPTEPGATAVPQVQVPPVSGLDRASAINAIIAAGLTPREDTPRNSDTVPSGEVIDQLPVAGTMLSQTEVVTFVVSLGPSVVVVTDVTRIRQNLAVDQLQARGLLVEVAEEMSDTVPKGFVIRQNPPSGFGVSAGDTVTIVVSTGNEFAMPDLAGMSESQAQQQLAELGLVYSYTDYQTCDKLGADLCSRYDPGMVVSTVPGVGQTVTRGTPVTLGVRSPE